MPIRGAALVDPVPIAQVLAAGLTDRPDKDAVASLEQRWSYVELDRASRRLAGRYSALGLKRGDRIASLMPNRGALLVHYLACLCGGFVAVPLNYRYTPVEMQHGIDKSGAAVLLFHDERRNDVEQLDAPSLQCVTYAAPPGGTEPTFEEMIAGADPVETMEPVDPDAPAFILFTSGSTGPAKGVTHSQRSFGYMVASAAATFEMTARDTVLPGSSMSHLGALLFSMATLSRGGTVAVARTCGPDEILPLLRRDRPTVLCMLPSALFQLVRDGYAGHDDFRSLRLVRCGSDKVPAELETEFTELTGLAIDEGYGCSETGLALLNPPSGRIVPGSVGQAAAGFELAIRDADGRELESGQQGSVWIRTPSVMTGYWGDPEATRAVLRDGWLDSGDVMRVDDQGYFWFCGRKKQIIVHDGSNIFPQEVEDALLLHPDVQAAGVVGLHDLVHGENVRAYVVAKPARTPTEAALIAFARERIGYKAPEEIRFLDEMPLNPTGKVDRVSLKKMAADAHDG